MSQSKRDLWQALAAMSKPRAKMRQRTKPGCAVEKLPATRELFRVRKVTVFGRRSCCPAAGWKRPVCLKGSRPQGQDTRFAKGKSVTLVKPPNSGNAATPPRVVLATRACAGWVARGAEGTSGLDGLDTLTVSGIRAGWASFASRALAGFGFGILLSRSFSKTSLGANAKASFFSLQSHSASPRHMLSTRLSVPCCRQIHFHLTFPG